MNEEERQWRNRFSELAERAYARGRYEFTDFLSLAEIQYLYSAERSSLMRASPFGAVTRARRDK
ncbi:MAG: hypothetical protein ACLS4Z_08890 [Christensenellaceae bacterium]